MFWSTASVDSTPARRYASPISAEEPRASPHVPVFVARCTEPGALKKKAVWTGPLGTVKSFIHRARTELMRELEHLRC